MSDNIGWATLSVIPGMAGFGAALSKGVEPQLAAAGLAGGSAFAKAFAPVAIAAAVIGIGVATTKMAADYQSATTLLVTGAGESEAAIGQVRQGLLDMAPAVGMGPTALAKAMFLVESAGFHGAAGLTVMAAAAQGAKVGGADATVVADGLTTAMIDYHFAVDQAATVTSKMVATVALGKTNMGDLSGALSNVLPFAANLKISFNDVMGAMATMTSQGIDASRASTMLKFGMMALANETPKGASALYSIGLTTQDVVTALGTKGLSGTIAEVTDAIGKKFPAGSAEAVAALSDIFGGTRGIGMALALSGQNAATFTANVASIAGAVPEANGAVKGWTLTQADLNTQLDQVGAFLSSVAIKLGTVLIPTVLQGTEKFRAFAAEFENGTGQGGKFRDILTDINDKGIKPFATFITGTAVPAVQSFVQWVKDNRVALEVLGTVITGALMPVFVTMAAAWVTVKLEAIASAAAQFGAHYTVAAGWLMSTGVAVSSAAETVAIWLMLEGDAVVKAAIVAAAWIGSTLGIVDAWLVTTGDVMADWIILQAESAKKAVIVALAWVGSTAGVVAGWTGAAAETVAIWLMLQWDAVKKAAIVAASWIGSTAGVVVAWVATNAVVVGGWIATAAVAMASGIKMAAAWVIGLGPVAWIIAAVVAVAAAFVWAYNNVGWFKDGVDWMCKTVGTSFVSMWNFVIQPVLVFLVNGLAGVMTTWGDMLVTLGHVPGFEWATDAGNKILGAAGAVRGFAADIRQIPANVPVSINVTANYSAAVATVLGGARAAIKLAGLPGAAEGGTFAPTPGGTIVRVAEAGRRETVVDTATLNAAMAQRNGAADIGAGSPNGPVTFNLYDADNILIGSMQGVAVGVYGQESAKQARQRGRAMR